jgi:amidase
MTQELWRRSAQELVALLTVGKVSAREIAADAMGRLGQVNGVINAVCTVNENLSRDADRCDARLKSGAPPRKLEGVPFLVKDNLDTAGMRTTYGSRLRENYVPTEDAISVARLRAAGALIVGKTNTPEFAHDVNTTNFLFGTTRNPWNPDASSGGSSGGSGAGIAAGIAPIGLGTDLGGSVRVPAAFNGILGLRAAPGRIPVYPADFGWDTLVNHVHGPFARTTGDIGLLLDVLSGPDERDPSSLPAHNYDYAAAARVPADLKGVRIAYIEDFNGMIPAAPDVVARVRQALKVFASLGCVVEEKSFDASSLREITAGTRAFGMIARYSAMYAAHADEMTEVLKNQIRASLPKTVADVTQSERLRTAYWHKVRALLENADYIMTPTCGIPAFRLDRPLPTEIGGKPVANFYDSMLACYAFSVTGLPAISVPCGLTSEGLPVGLQIVGHRFREDTLLRAAAAYEAAQGGSWPMPNVNLNWRPGGPETVTAGFSAR